MLPTTDDPKRLFIERKHMKNMSRFFYMQGLGTGFLKCETEAPAIYQVNRMTRSIKKGG